jgi:hypothetical protein
LFISGKWLRVCTATSNSLVMSDSRRTITTRRKYLRQTQPCQVTSLHWHTAGHYETHVNQIHTLGDESFNGDDFCSLRPLSHTSSHSGWSCYAQLAYIMRDLGLYHSARMLHTLVVWHLNSTG